MSALADRLRELLAAAADAYAGRPSAARLEAARARLDEPLRVAIAGRVKAGKSTLLNALVGESLAPTDAGECTRIVTWYRDGHTYRVTLEPMDGPAATVPFRRDDGALEVELGGRAPESVRRLVVDWPSARLRDMTLIDTPGIASLSFETAQRTVDFLTPDADEPGQADAVVYLLRHVHTADLRFLEAFHDRDLAQPTPVNAVGVLSRADEVGACRRDALDSAGRIATRYRTDPRIRRLCQTVVPVAGLLAQAAATLTESEVITLRPIAQLPEASRDGLLLTADRFRAERDDVPAVPAEREHLLERLGLFGVRLAVDRLAREPGTTATELAATLRAASGVDDLREVLHRQLAARAAVLKARSAATVLERVLADDPVPATAEIAGDLEALLAGAHDYAELRLLNLLRAGALALADREVEEADRLLGGAGTSPASRLAVQDGAPADEVRARATEAMAGWQRRAENPLSSREVKDAARTLVRTCEGIVAGLA